NAPNPGDSRVGSNLVWTSDTFFLTNLSANPATFGISGTGTNSVSTRTGPGMETENEQFAFQQFNPATSQWDDITNLSINGGSGSGSITVANQPNATFTLPGNGQVDIREFHSFTGTVINPTPEPATFGIVGAAL